MRLILFTLPVAIALGYVLGGRLGHLAEISLRYPGAGLAGLGLQTLPVGGTLGHILLLGSFVLLLLVAGANWRLPGFVLVGAGLWLNLVVIAVNGGMPVTADAFVASGQTEGLDDLAAGGRHHLATPRDELVFLADSIPVPAPVRRAMSVGDLAAYAGAMWFVVAGMGRRDEIVEPKPHLDVAEATG
jgi:hypothetical protein